MKYFKDRENTVYAYSEEDDDVKVGLVSITEKEAMDIANPPLTKDERIQKDEAYRKQLLNEADAVMIDWRTELMLGEISDVNKDKLSRWLAYKNDVKAVDVSLLLGESKWPDKPEY